MAKPGFKIIERKDKYYEEADAVGNERGNRLFARGDAYGIKLRRVPESA